MWRLLPVLLLLSACQRALPPVSVSPQLYEIGARPPVQAEEQTEQTRQMAATIAPYKEQLDAKMNRVLAEVAVPLIKASPEGNLGNWMADIMYEAASAYFPARPIAFAATNSGGLRVGEIGTGPLLVSEIYELMPFDNALVVLELNGLEVKEFLNHIANGGGWPVSDQLRVARSADGKLDVRISGESLDPAKTYYVATIDYVANGGSNSSMLVGKQQLATGMFLRDVLIDYAARSDGPIRVIATGERMRL